MTKSELRREMKRRNLSLTAEERAERSRSLFSRVEQLPEFAAAGTVAFFCALNDEPETLPALVRWSGLGKRIVVPRVEGERMEFFEYTPETLCAGAFGISEPGAGAVLCPPAEIDLVVVPGTAFSPQGARMGRGRGYYDRYLSRSDFRGAKIGVCYAHQLVGKLPVEPHDVAMDRVVTECGTCVPA
ncbi:5-formyltetrahydrofolate cyclo-ligase [Alistipes sp.]|uniref:5-formyltetrahydrofolate cyclo-ligase n=1 Tax=Alistipes sp. TaxID=1872444 RepID=UPI0025B8534A|nr:5-formyltetrahydrofolate cyclo-ligase [Alistipes sp.]MCI7139745.1 5-formyltetrahydrofolate cyclo-ligase [Alistipes sp.]MDY5396679.1 5-formyltetrahydrofolate cyclo-ligase [Alistipes sp.]